MVECSGDTGADNFVAEQSNPPPTISLITVCFNSAATIADTLRSVAAQSHPAIEHIVIDGGSTDGTMKIVGDSRRQLAHVVSEPDGGIYDAMNKGLALATGDVVGFLNADDFYATSNALERVAAPFADPEVDAVYADLVYVSATDTNRVVRYWKSRDYQPGLFLGGWMPAHPTFFVRRAIYKKLGGFDTTFRRQADFELTMRFLEIHRIRSVYLPTILVKMRIGGASNNSMINIIKGNIEAYRACKKHHLPVTWFFILNKLISRVPQFFYKP
jgi:glycosyltransferase involved in cell wall biosynthesis